MSLQAQARSWAQFAGLGARRARKASEDDDEPNDRNVRHGARAGDDDDEDDKPKGRKASDAPDNGDDGDTDPADLKRGKRGSRAEDPDEDGEAEEDDKPKARKARRARAEDDEDDYGEDDERRNKGARRARASEDDDDEDDDKSEMSGRSAVASARRRERARCAAILGSPAARGNVDLACSLAFDTTLTRHEANAVLRRTPARAAEGGRADRNPRLAPGGGPAPSSGQAIAASWDAALTKAGAVKPQAQDQGWSGAFARAR